MTPDRRSHRGPHPRDADLFHERHHSTLRCGVLDLSWLLTQGYSTNAALKLVGDRHTMTSRQRMAVLRCSASDQMLHQIRSSTVERPSCSGSSLGIDGYNALITLETALSGGLVLVGRDGRCRDLASVHGNYRKVKETDQSLGWILEMALGLLPSRIDLYLDSPVSNSARLKTRIAELLEKDHPDNTIPFNIELAQSPDRLLKKYNGIVATADSAVLRHCDNSLDLAGSIIRRQVPQAWVLDLRDPALQDGGDDGTRW